MAREINGTQPYQDKLVKLVPTEIVGAYMVLAGMLGFGAGGLEAQALAAAAPATAGAIPAATLNEVLIQVVFVALMIATPLYLSKISRVANWRQILVTTISYIVWVYTLGGPFVVWGIYFPAVGSVVLVLWSVFSPLMLHTVESSGSKAGELPEGA